jgi:hypothetical protein
MAKAKTDRPGTRASRAAGYCQEAVTRKARHANMFALFCCSGLGLGFFLAAFILAAKEACLMATVSKLGMVTNSVDQNWREYLLCSENIKTYLKRNPDTYHTCC